MGNDLFTNFAIPATSTQPKVVNAKSNEKQEATTTAQANVPATETTKKSSALETAKKIAPIVLPLASIPITALISYKVAGKAISSKTAEFTNSVAALREAVAQNSVELKKAVEFAEKTAAEQSSKNGNAIKSIMTTLAAAAGLTAVYEAGKNDDEISNGFIDSFKKIGDTSTEAISKANKAVATSGKSLNGKYTKSDIGGIPLLYKSNTMTKNNSKYNKAIDTIQNSANQYLFKGPDITPIKSENPVIWSITSEFAPIKEGGLGSVPVEVQNNVTKLGVNIPTFIPMYQQEGLASFDEENGKYTYHYKNKDYDLKKVASFDVDAYQGGSSKTENVEIYVSDTKDEAGNDKQLVFIKNNNYFNGTIYEASNRTEEPEKFAFFSKAVYEFMKAKSQLNSVKNAKIFDRAAFDSIKEPDALMLNDWQASPVAALARYKAPMENAYGQLSDSVSEKISKMNIITIGHNAMYQGSSANDNNAEQRVESTSNILNTLFDGFTYDIVKNANSGASKSDPSDAGLENLDNVLMMNANNSDWSHTNLLNMGITLSDYFHPVSKNYAQELLMTDDDHKHLSGELQWSLTKKNESGALYGVINGNDFNNLSIEANAKKIKDVQTGLDYKTYNKKSNIKDVMAARKANKENFYNNYMIPFTMKNNPNNNSDAVNAIREKSKALEFVDPTGKMVLPNLTAEELDNTPIISSVGRFVTQKGVDIMCDAIKILFDNWEKDFPGKNKPIFYIAGSDGEGGRQRKFVEDLKATQLSEKDNNRVVFAHGFAPMHAMTSASDFFLMPSRFEPCGLTQGESFALATPVIASAVGGIVDTVNRNGKTNGILTDKDKTLTPETLYDAMKKGLDIYFNDKEKYSKMVNDSLAEDFSWIQPGKQGPVYDYLEKIGIDKETLPDVADLK